MNINSTRSLAVQLSYLPIGVSRTSIRYVTSASKKKRAPIPPNFKAGHGEKIWVFNHFVRGMTVYGHEPVMKSNRALKQIPFNGKKLKPAKLRKDYWRPMAMIQFPEGMGHVGRSVYHLMREFRMAHELSWDDEMLRDDATGRTLTKHERGAKLNDQKPNSIADMAAVLGGAGKGNKIWMTVAEGGDNVETKALNLTDGETGAALGLVKATIFWSDAMDRNYALEWPPNVSHAEFAGSTQQFIEEAEAQQDTQEGQAGQEGQEDQEKQTTAPAEVGIEQLPWAQQPRNP